MASKGAIECIKSEFNKFNVVDGSLDGQIDLKILESNFRILTFESDISFLGKEELIEIVPGALLSLSSSDKNLRLLVGRFLQNLKDVIKTVNYKQTEWDTVISIEFLKICTDRLRCIVEEYSDDWIEPWLLLVNITFTNADGELCSSKLNYLLSVIEKAFKTAKVKKDSVKTTFQVWERFNTILAESQCFPKVVNTAKILHLLVLPFVGIKLHTADPYKHKAWFHVIEKIGLHSVIAVQKIVHPFLQFLIDNKRIFIKFPRDIGSYLKTMSSNIHVASNYYSNVLRCLELSIEHNSKLDDVISAWTSLCGHMTSSGMDHEYFKSLLNFLKNRPEDPGQRELLMRFCLVANQHKLFDFKSVYFEDIRSAIEEVFPLTMFSLIFREKVFNKLLNEMMEITDDLMQKNNQEEEGCMEPIISMWEIMAYVYSDFVSTFLDSGFEPMQIDIDIISDLLIFALTQTLFEGPLNEETALCIKLKQLIHNLVKKIKTELFSNEFLNKFENEIKSSHIGLENCLWLASFTSKLDSDLNLIPLLSIMMKNVAGCSQPKIVLEFLHLLDLSTEKVDLKITFKPSLNYLRKFSSTYEPPYDNQIRQLAHNLLKRVPETSDNKVIATPNSEVDDKKSNIRSPLTVHSNFLSRLSKAEEKKNHKINLAASIFPRGDTDKNELNKENKSIDKKESQKAKSIKTSDVADIHLSPVADRFAKSSGFILDNSESSESPLVDDSVEPKVSSFKVSTDFHKTVTPVKTNAETRMVAGLSPKYDSNKTKENNLGEALPSSLQSPKSNNNMENLNIKKSPSTPSSASKTNSKNKYCFLDNNSMDAQDFVFVPPKLKSKESPLTNHQKEVMKKRREEIPALYQDLSQDTQNTSENSSQENSVFSITLNSKKDDTIKNNCKNIDDDSCKGNESDNVVSFLNEENTVFNGFSEGKQKRITENEGENIVIPTEDMTPNKAMSPKRLNFEGVCIEETSKNKDSVIPRRQYARKSTSKYKKTLNSNNENGLSPRGKKRKNSDDLQIESEEDNLPSMKISCDQNAPQDKINEVKVVKRRGRPKSNTSKIINNKDESNNDKSSYNITNISTIKTRRLRKSKTLENCSDTQKHSETDILKTDGNNITNHILSVSNTSIEINQEPSDNEFVLKDTPETMVTPNKDKLIEVNQENSDIKSPNLNTNNQITLPLSETPNRRKRSKKLIQFNEFSPKMLRKNRNNVKISPAKGVNRKPAKRIKLSNDSPSHKEKANIQSDQLKAEGFEINKIKAVNLQNDNKIIPEISSIMTENKEQNISPNNSTVDNIVNITVKSNSPPKTVPAKDVSTPLISKTSPNRAMKIMQLANYKLQIKSKMKSLVAASNVAEEKVKPSREETLKNQRNKILNKFNSCPRAAIILKLAETECVSDEIIKNDIEQNEKDNQSDIILFQSNSDKMSEENTNDISKNLEEDGKLLKGKRKSVAKSPVEKKIELESPSKSDITPGSKSKRSSLDSWIIKKEKSPQIKLSNEKIKYSIEKALSQANDLIDTTVPDEEINDFSPCISDSTTDETIINPSCGEISGTNQSEDEETPLKANEHSELESSKLSEDSEVSEVEDGSSESTRPKRSRKEKKPTDFIYLNTGRRSKNNDNKITPTKRKQKPQKQMDLSPSRSYSYINWPKGDCEVWVAYEPTPPEASPASAILKRKSVYCSPQTSPSATPKKRVSFLDPVVTKGLLYNKGECGGKIQHAHSENGKSPTMRRKIPEFNSTREGENPELLDSPIKSIDDNSIESSITPIESLKEVPCESLNESLTQVAIEEVISNDADSKTGVIADAEKMNEDKNLNEDCDELCEPLPVDNSISDEIREPVREATLVTTIVHNDNCDMEVCNLNESNLEQLDIVERVVGNVSKEACIVEPVEECNIRDISSDESESDYAYRMSISDDIHIIPTEDKTNLDVSSEKDDFLLNRVESDECIPIEFESKSTEETESPCKDSNEIQVCDTEKENDSTDIINDDNVKEINNLEEDTISYDLSGKIDSETDQTENQETNLTDSDKLNYDSEDQSSSKVIEVVTMNENSILDGEVHEEPNEMLLAQENVQNNCVDDKDENKLVNVSDKNEENVEVSEDNTATEMKPTDDSVVEECDRFGNFLNRIDIRNLSIHAFQKLSSTLVTGLQKLYVRNPHQDS